MSLNVDTDAVLLIDAENAFNSINHKLMLHNLKFICPIIATYIIHCYATPSRLFIAGGGEILSSEGATQGDPPAMRAYPLGILPLIYQYKRNECQTSSLCGRLFSCRQFEEH